MACVWAGWGSGLAGRRPAVIPHPVLTVPFSNLVINMQLEMFICTVLPFVWARQAVVIKHFYCIMVVVGEPVAEEVFRSSFVLCADESRWGMKEF